MGEEDTFRSGMVGENEMTFVQECNEKSEEVCQEVSETRCQVGAVLLKRPNTKQTATSFNSSIEESPLHLNIFSAAAASSGNLLMGRRDGRQIGRGESWECRRTSSLIARRYS